MLARLLSGCLDVTWNLDTRIVMSNISSELRIYMQFSPSGKWYTRLTPWDDLGVTGLIKVMV
jgi:hypothetical protein